MVTAVEVMMTAVEVMMTADEVMVTAVNLEDMVTAVERRSHGDSCRSHIYKSRSW